MSYTNAQIQGESKGGLPVPIWEVHQEQVRTFYDFSIALCEIPRARVPFINPELIAEGNLYVEYGRIRGSRYRSRPVPKRYGKGRIYAWSNWTSGVTSGTGYGGGVHSGVSIQRPNRFLITNIGFLAPECPYWAFYKKKTGELFNGSTAPISSTLYYSTPGEPFSSIFNPVKSLPPSLGGTYMSPYYNRFHNIRFASTKWYARIIKVVDGRVEEVGDWSEELIVSQTPYPTGYNKSKGVQVDNILPVFKCVTSNHRQPI